MTSSVVSTAIATITSQLEYVAELDAQLSSHTHREMVDCAVAKARSALETELVRLDLENAETNMWKSSISALEWFLKFPTKPLTFDTFKHVITDINVELVQLLLLFSDIDPSADDNYAIRWASRFGQTAVVEVLLADHRVDPSENDNCAICTASANGHTDVVKLLLADERVNPSAKSNNAIRLASHNGHVDVVKLLLADPRLSGPDPHGSAMLAAVQYV